MAHWYNIDIETYSSIDLGSANVYKYAESPDFEILLFSYSVDGGPVQAIDLANGEELPQQVLADLRDDTVIKWAFNASFERICLSKFLKYPPGQYLTPEAWRCTMIWAATLGLPNSLKDLGTVLGLEKQKLTEGADLIRYFCIPCKPTMANGERTRNLPSHAPDKWERFIAYNIRDVETEMGIQKRLAKYPPPEFIWAEYHLDQKINDYGVLADMHLVNKAIEMDAASKQELGEAMINLTGLENPNSVQQMTKWLSDRGVIINSLDKKTVSRLIKTATPEIKDVLCLRQKLAKSSIRKYQAIANTACEDSRVRGMFRFYGAGRTGRWSGKGVQLQNLPQNKLPDLEDARALVKLGYYDTVKALYGDVPDTLSQLIRTAFVPPDGHKLIVADFSAIEARILCWLAGEQWRQRAFAEGKDIYCASASQMFGEPVEKHGVNGHLRQKGKIAELALGYGGSEGALKAMGALEMGLEDDELKPLVNSWRQANPRIVQYWWDVDRAAKSAIEKKTTIKASGLVFSYRSGMLFITLPSSRNLAYVKPKIESNHYGGKSITYEGIGATKKWERLETYGPKLVENITQAIARDVLCFAMMNLKEYPIVMHIHDEIVLEATPTVSLQHVCEKMGQTPPWADGLLLRADGYETDFYKKD